jgi:hypothetical protein
MDVMKIPAAMILLTLGGLLLEGSHLHAQSTAGTQVPSRLPLGPAPNAIQAPAPRAPIGPACGTTDGYGPRLCTVCVRQPEPATKKVYACKCEAYCLPCCAILSLLHGGCGCDGGPCGPVRFRHRLIVRKVDTCGTLKCVPQLVPVESPCPCGPSFIRK